MWRGRFSHTFWRGSAREFHPGVWSQAIGTEQPWEQMCPVQGSLNRFSPNTASVPINATGVSGLAVHAREVPGEEKSAPPPCPAAESRVCPQAAPLGFEWLLKLWPLSS